MALQDDLATLKANNEADAAVLATLEATLNVAPEPSVGDALLGVLVSTLEAHGYTVTAPVVPSDSGVSDAAPSL